MYVSTPRGSSSAWGLAVRRMERGSIRQLTCGACSVKCCLRCASSFRFLRDRFVGLSVTKQINGKTVTTSILAVPTVTLETLTVISVSETRWHLVNSGLHDLGPRLLWQSREVGNMRLHATPSRWVSDLIFSFHIRITSSSILEVVFRY